jgi:integrase
MSTLRQNVDEYLALRRALGFKLDRAGHLLPDFVTHLERHGSSVITVELALAWAKQPPDADSSWWSTRLGVVRVFARHLQAIDPRTQVPPRELLPARSRRATPYLYSPREVAQLMRAARTFRSPFKAQTYATIIGLLAVTGLRIGEAIRLDRQDVDLAEGVLLIHKTKFDKSREVPLHTATTEALRAYARRRDQHWPKPKTPSFLVSTAGTRLLYSNVQLCFGALGRAAGLERRSERCRPRIHDLRHTFAVQTLLGWYRTGVDVEANLPRLSTYLGHVAPSCTYWYLSAAPELLQLAAARLEPRMGDEA